MFSWRLRSTHSQQQSSFLFSADGVPSVRSIISAWGHHRKTPWSRSSPNTQGFAITFSWKRELPCTLAAGLPAGLPACGHRAACDSAPVGYGIQPQLCLQRLENAALPIHPSPTDPQRVCIGCSVPSSDGPPWEFDKVRTVSLGHIGWAPQIPPRGAAGFVSIRKTYG